MDSTRGHFVTNVEPGRSAELRRRPESFRVPDQRESVPRISGRNRNCRRMIVPAILSTPAGRRDLTDIIARPRAPPAWIDALAAFPAVLNGWGLGFVGAAQGLRQEPTGPQPRSTLAGVLVDGPTRGIPEFQPWPAPARGGGERRRWPAGSAQSHKAPDNQPNHDRDDRIRPGDPPRGNQEGRDAGRDEKQGNESKQTRCHG